MQPSPIQLRQLFFRHIFIHPNNEDDENIVALDFDFDGVVIQDGSRIKLIEHNNSDQVSIYCVNLRIVIQNEEGKICPYTIDIEAAGFFEILNKGLEENKREELALINGCSMLYSVIREHVMSFTTRCPHGTLILPTVNFLDKIKKEELSQIQDQDSEQTESKPKKRKKIAKPKES